MTHPLSSRCRQASPRAASIPPRQGGFTLLEMAVVLAVIMILSLAVFSTTLRQLDRVAADKEAATLASYADALKASILRNGYIPAATNWAAVVATELGANPFRVAINPRGRPRILLVDPGLRLGSSGSGLPYMQTNGTPTPSNLCLMWISSLGPAPLPAALTNNTYTRADFTNTWNWDLSSGSRPALWNSYAGSNDELQVKRVNLAGSFVRLILVNYPPTTALTNQGRYRLGEQASLLTVGTNGVNAFFLQDTLIHLINADGTPDAQLLSRDASFFYNVGVWGAYPKTEEVPTVGLGALMEQTMAEFRNSPANSNAKSDKGQPQPTPGSVADAMNDFMLKYLQWATAGFPDRGSIRDSAKAANDLVIKQMQYLSDNFKPGGCY